MSYAQLMQLLTTRRSVRRFKPDAIEENLVCQLVEAARWAPSAGNRQAFRILAIRDAKTRQAMLREVQAAISELTDGLRESIRREVGDYLTHFTVFAGAPLVLAPIHRAGPDLLDTVVQSKERRRADADALAGCAAAIMNLLLAAHALGLGACWMTGPLVARAALEQLLRVPRGWTLSALIPVGVPAETPAAPKRRDAKRLISWLDPRGER